MRCIVVGAPETPPKLLDLSEAPGRTENARRRWLVVAGEQPLWFLAALRTTRQAATWSILLQERVCCLMLSVLPQRNFALLWFAGLVFRGPCAGRRFKLDAPLELTNPVWPFLLRGGARWSISSWITGRFMPGTTRRPIGCPVP